MRVGQPWEMEGEKNKKIKRKKMMKSGDLDVGVWVVGEGMWRKRKERRERRKRK